MENLSVEEVLSNSISIKVPTSEPNTEYEIIYTQKRNDEMLNVVSVQITENFKCYSWRKVNPQNGESVYLGTGDSLEEALTFKTFEKMIKPSGGTSAQLITDAAIKAAKDSA